VQPLPPLERPSPEARAGVPEIAGAWLFAGWEVASEAVLAETGEPAAPGDLVIELQRVDSLAAQMLRGEVAIPLVGEVRRDGIVSFATHASDPVRRFAAGRVSGDTLWLELSTLPAGELSPPAVRWAYVRGAVGQRWLRLPSGQLLRDTAVVLPPQPETVARPAVPTPGAEEADAPVPSPLPAAPPPAAPDTPRVPQDTAPRTSPATAPDTIEPAPGSGIDIP
jgi:hypothetical protein